MSRERRGRTSRTFRSFWTSSTSSTSFIVWKEGKRRKSSTVPSCRRRKKTTKKRKNPNGKAQATRIHTTCADQVDMHMPHMPLLLSMASCASRLCFCVVLRGLTEKTLCAENERITAEAFAAWKARETSSFSDWGEAAKLLQTPFTIPFTIPEEQSLAVLSLTNSPSSLIFTCHCYFWSRQQEREACESMTVDKMLKG